MLGMSLFALLMGFALLMKGADIFVDGASNVAYNYGIPAVIVGLTIVAFGTSAPEAAISMNLAHSGNTTAAIGNVVGSNIFNILGVIGVSALLGTLTVDKILIKRDFPFLIVSTIGLLLIAIFLGTIDRPCGAIFLAIIIAYVYYLVKKAGEDKEAISEESEIKLTVPKATIYILIGIVGIIIGSELVKYGANNIAGTFGMSEELIGLTVLAIGTSLPELATSVSALKKGETGIVVGNVLGSSIFNILFILGITSVIKPIKIEADMVLDIFLMTIITIVGAWFTYTKSEVDKKEGAILVILYIAYMVFTVLRYYGLI